MGRSHQDEEFSYVVIRRGPRPLVGDRVAEDGFQRDAAAGRGGRPPQLTQLTLPQEWQLPESVIKRQIMLNRCQRC